MQYSTTLKSFLRKNHNTDAISRMLYNFQIEEDICDFIAIRGEMLTYMPYGRLQKFTDSGRWVREGRQEIKPAKLARKIIGDERIQMYGLKDTDFEKFSNLLKSYVTSNGCDEQGVTTSLHVVNGEFITHYYTMDLNYDKTEGSSLHGSCMQGNKAEHEYFEIYEKNPKHCSMLVLLDNDNDLLGRALVWKKKDTYYMDRIYTIDKYMDVFIDFAKENGMYYKQYQSAGYSYFNMLNGNIVNGEEIEIGLINYSFSYYPYVDTMKYLTEDGILTNGCPSDSTNYYELNCTNGGYNEHEATPMVYDDFTGDDIEESDAVHMDYSTPSNDSFSGYTHGDNVVYARTERGRENRLEDHTIYISGDYYETGHSDIVYSEYLNDYAHADNMVYSDSENDYIPSDEAIYCEETEQYFLIGSQSYNNLKSNQ